MINALSAWICLEPGVPAEVLCPYCDDTVTHYLEFGSTLKNCCLKTGTYSAGMILMTCESLFFSVSASLVSAFVTSTL